MMRSRANRIGHVWRIKHIVIGLPVEPVELALSILSLAIGLWLMNPWSNTFANPSFAFMAHVADQWVWGLGLAVMGSSRLVAVSAENPSQHRTPAFVGAVVWVLLAGSIALANPATLAIPLYGFLAVASMWVYWRWGVDRHE